MFEYGKILITVTDDAVVGNFSWLCRFDRIGFQLVGTMGTFARFFDEGGLRIDVAEKIGSGRLDRRIRPRPH